MPCLPEQVAAATIWRTYMLESGHPYDSGTTQTFYVSFKGAVKLVVSFHLQVRPTLVSSGRGNGLRLRKVRLGVTYIYPFVVCVTCQSHTEANRGTNCDYVAFYDDLNHVKRWGQERYSGRDGAEDWRGFGGRPPLEVWGHQCMLIRGRRGDKACIILNDFVSGIHNRRRFMPSLSYYDVSRVRRVAIGFRCDGLGLEDDYHREARRC